MRRLSSGFSLERLAGDLLLAGLGQALGLRV